MKTLGVIGGLGPESTIDYYRSLIAAFQQRTGASNLPSLIINSLDVYHGLRLVEQNQLGELAEYLAGGVKRLADAGADFAIISANTPHLVFDEVQRRSSIPLISIVEVAREAARRAGVRRAGLLGTRFTMQARFYSEVFARDGIDVVVPSEDDIAYIHDKYINELLKGIFQPATKSRLSEIVAAMREQHGVEAVVLAGTELPLILTENPVAGVPVLDTTKIHAEAAVSRLLE